MSGLTLSTVEILFLVQVGVCKTGLSDVLWLAQVGFCNTGVRVCCGWHMLVVVKMR